MKFLTLGRGTATAALALVLLSSGAPASSYSVIYSFPVYTGDPYVLLAGQNGVLYGSLGESGDSTGEVFQLTPPSAGKTSWSYSAVWTFHGKLSGSEGDGTFPNALALGGSGELVGGRVRQRGGNFGVAEAAPDHAAAVVIWVGTTSSAGGVNSAIASVCM